MKSRSYLCASNRRLGLLAMVLAAASLPAAANEMATVTYTPTPLGGGMFRYNLVLTDTGTENINTLWFGWIPGQDFMNTLPANIMSPAPWTAMATNGGAGDGYAIQWVSNGAPLTPGNSLSGFQFDSATTPQQLAGMSPFHPSLETTSFVYSGAPFVGDSFEFTATQTPEPSAVLLTLLGGAFLISRRCLSSSRPASR
jgi:hypothetical protein